jgi:hypothetical protein
LRHRFGITEDAALHFGQNSRAGINTGLQAGAQNPSGLEAVSTAFIWALRAREPLKRLLRVCIENTGLKAGVDELQFRRAAWRNNIKFSIVY